MITPELMSMLWCPTCQESELGSSDPSLDIALLETGELRCERCGSSYPVRYGVPILIPEAALSGDQWSLWKAHLEKFQARREERRRKPRRRVIRRTKRSRQGPFAEFTGVREGTVLDVGCGPGKFRHFFDPDGVRYVGLDPIVLPEVSEFPFVQGLAEYIPFMENTFTDIFVLSALDHFRDLDRFLEEARRVLVAGGRLHISQSVHEARGPVSAARVVAHKLKDALDDRKTRSRAGAAPKHLYEFTGSSLIERVGSAFRVVATETRGEAWYRPVKLFATFTPKEVRPAAEEARTLEEAAGAGTAG